MKTALETAIESFLQNEMWKEFIIESGNDRNNSLLESLNVTERRVTNSRCEFDVEISYKILEDADRTSYGNGIAAFSRINNDFAINNIIPLPQV